ncbi:hypothetical protein [Rhodococcus sp. (in: high G+C Gram-positive bacteria)]|uniref:hypothetical protein n=1 Tax=Rhodococcus sp. TaxID=1831 RepID=UPI00257A36E9|nr:hypothetical protein [Rhodococcus sp. (in: high G+C Gram-positive bacteria)]
MKCRPITRGLATAAAILALSTGAVATAQPATDTGTDTGSEYVSLGDSFISVGSYQSTSR